MYYGRSIELLRPPHRIQQWNRSVSPKCVETSAVYPYPLTNMPLTVNRKYYRDRVPVAVALKCNRIRLVFEIDTNGNLCIAYLWPLLKRSIKSSKSPSVCGSRFGSFPLENISNRVTPYDHTSDWNEYFARIKVSGAYLQNSDLFFIWRLIFLWLV